MEEEKINSDDVQVLQNDVAPMAETRASKNVTLADEQGNELYPKTVLAQVSGLANMSGATSAAAGKAGLVPAPAAGKQTSFLKGDGTWAVPTFTIPKATAAALGGIMIGYTANGKNYPIVLDDSGKAYVAVPWTDTKYSNMTAATASAAGKAGLAPAPPAGSQAKFLRGDGTWQAPTFTIPQAAADTLGGIKLGYAASGKNYPVVLDTNGKAYVAVPWSDTNTTYAVFKAASASAAGGTGLVPAPAAGAQTKFLRGDGTWQTTPNTTYSAFKGASEAAAGGTGLVPAPAAGRQNAVLFGDGTFRHLKMLANLAATVPAQTDAGIKAYLGDLTVDELINVFNRGQFFTTAYTGGQSVTPVPQTPLHPAGLQENKAVSFRGVINFGQTKLVEMTVGFADGKYTSLAYKTLVVEKEIIDLGWINMTTLSSSVTAFDSYKTRGEYSFCTANYYGGNRLSVYVDSDGNATQSLRYVDEASGMSQTYAVRKWSGSAWGAWVKGRSVSYI